MTILLLVNVILPAFAREVTLYWEPSPSPDVIGYKVYYQQGAPKLPLSGTEADQGTSPIDVENSLMVSISGLDESVVYYFSVTAYDSSYNESTFSNIVSTTWMPPLLSPQKESLVVPWNVAFQWDAGPYEHYLNYTLYYGTDKDMVINAGVTPYRPGSSSNIHWPAVTNSQLILIALIVMLTLLSTTGPRGWRAAYPRRIAVAGLFFVSLVACGGGGSDSSGDVAYFSSTTLMSVATGNSTSYQTDDLQSGTTYYWKVNAQSTTEPGTVYHSETYSFTTQ
ncbi:fibronectin type III domain-containing protein [Pelobacter sp. M08fum]|uniref:Fibronectin type III domain-containing protein n=2 Tax=Pelovirga terrestris TaxID=2771352 RepID=A0A8J6R4G5_9BACT|nr:fibronectin type III domain-containing protein [Pelovirga terrestris]